MLLWAPLIYAQSGNDPFNSSRKKVGNENASAFNQGRASNFNDYREKLNAEYVSKTREKWKSFNSFRGIIEPEKDVKPVDPICMSDEEARKAKENRQLNFDEIIRPLQGKSTPQPITPIKEVPENSPQYFSFSYLGTTLQVRKPQNTCIKLSGLSENAIADTWEALCSPPYNNMIFDCLKLRSSLKLCDWAYLMMLKELSKAYCGTGTNEATLLMAFLYSQSGYKMRLGQANGKLEMLYASQHNVYNTPYFSFDDEKFYALSKESGSIQVCAAKYPKEQSMSLWVSHEPKVEFQASNTRTLTASRYPEIAVHTSINRNLLAFYDSYPASEVGGNFMTRWAMYANTPICDEVKNELYPQLKKYIQGRSKLDAAERLLNFVQTAFTYEYDDKVWGGDRAFFAEETLYYPYCDCEDRSILFSHLVRDLLGLKVVLVYYPGHLATAVQFNEEVNGDYLVVNGRKYTICDPTYIGASIGRTMPQMDNSTAKVIILN